MRIRIFGDSHTIALRRAWAATRVPGVDLEIEAAERGAEIYKASAFYEVRDGELAVTKNGARKAFVSLTGRDTVERDTLYGLCMGLHLPGIFRHPDWRRLAPWTVAHEVGVEPVSTAVMQAIFLHLMRNPLGFFAELARRQIPFFVLAGPPPRRGHRAMLLGTSPRTVAEVCRFCGEFFRAHLRAHGYRLIDPPEGTTDDEGFLKAEYERPLMNDGSPDHSHANEKFGALYLGKVLAEATAV